LPAASTYKTLQQQQLAAWNSRRLTDLEHHMDVANWGILAGVLQALIFWAFLAAIIIGPRFLRSRDRDKLHETLRIAYEKG